ncbi:Tripartite ATP-independent periplasmic transporter, DctQ component [Roseovarius sp. THAF9]|uniref:TRAP transporter small permease n=1 Tax=Roseovarius sp. THAF9 TaxID=2587847 RepID=UPI001268F53E|nr:TRAP transporter small permease subunit [Roseovarius sp. THAF9]QFT93587.1 Tripartite ATP-independent periplasmic transporter, DctQ component [Roseovarius sp. THAF9]
MSTGGSKKPSHEVGKGRARPFPRAVLGVVSAFEWSGKIIAVATLAVMFFALFTNVVLRYAFGSGIPWAYEIHAVLLPWLVAGGIVIAAAQGRNIAIALLPNMLNQRSRLALLLLVNVLVVVISVSVLWSSQPILKASQFQRLSTLGIKQIWGYSSLVYAFGAMSVIGVLHAAQLLIEGAPRQDDPANKSLS